MPCHKCHKEVQRRVRCRDCGHLFCGSCTITTRGPGGAQSFECYGCQYEREAPLREPKVNRKKRS